MVEILEGKGAAVKGPFDGGDDVQGSVGGKEDRLLLILGAVGGRQRRQAAADNGRCRRERTGCC